MVADHILLKLVAQPTARECRLARSRVGVVAMQVQIRLPAAGCTLLHALVVGVAVTNKLGDAELEAKPRDKSSRRKRLKGFDRGRLRSSEHEHASR